MVNLCGHPPMCSTLLFTVDSCIFTCLQERNLWMSGLLNWDTRFLPLECPPPDLVSVVFLLRLQGKQLSLPPLSWPLLLTSVAVMVSCMSWSNRLDGVSRRFEGFWGLCLHVCYSMSLHTVVDEIIVHILWLCLLKLENCAWRRSPCIYVQQQAKARK